MLIGIAYSERVNRKSSNWKRSLCVSNLHRNGSVILDRCFVEINDKTIQTERKKFHGTCMCR